MNPIIMDKLVLMFGSGKSEAVILLFNSIPLHSVGNFGKVTAPFV